MVRPGAGVAAALVEVPHHVGRRAGGVPEDVVGAVAGEVAGRRAAVVAVDLERHRDHRRGEGVRRAEVPHRVGRRPGGVPQDLVGSVAVEVADERRVRAVRGELGERPRERPADAHAEAHQGVVPGTGRVVEHLVAPVAAEEVPDHRCVGGRRRLRLARLGGGEQDGCARQDRSRQHPRPTTPPPVSRPHLSSSQSSASPVSMRDAGEKVPRRGRPRGPPSPRCRQRPGRGPTGVPLAVPSAGASPGAVGVAERSAGAAAGGALGHSQPSRCGLVPT